MVLQRTTGVNTEDEDAEDKEDDENYDEIYNEGANEGKFCLSLISYSCVRLLCG